jgi:hypothetical protein
MFVKAATADNRAVFAEKEIFLLTTKLIWTAPSDKTLILEMLADSLSS